MGFPAAAVGSGAFVLAAMGAESLRRNSAPVKIMRYLGKISYGLYVYNAMAYCFGALVLYRVVAAVLPASGRWWTMTLSYGLIVFGLNVAMAAASYRWLEAPFLRLKERFTGVPSRAV
jgi:peptidoglycan/LPS O-acetylase OafA/YrhL